MLKTRIITAVVLLAVLVPALFLLPSRGWAALTLLAMSAAAWEWGRLCGFARGGAIGLAVLTGASGALILLLPQGDDIGQAMLYAAAAIWIVAVPAWLRWRERVPAGLLLAALGWLLLLACWFAVWKFRELGALYLLLLMVTVWVADIAAYFAGKAFGRHKLAPAISPGKTWEGVAGAVVGVQAYALALLCIAAAAPNYFAGLSSRVGVAGTLAVALILTGISVIGDLFESLLKRRAGLKDSSNLLPGHGGVLDRIDALVSTLPVALALAVILATRA